MSRFKKGDRVRCVETDGTFPKLDMEQEYIVASADAYEVRLEGRGAWSFHPRRFVLAAPAPVLDPFEWDYSAVCKATGYFDNNVILFARWLWAVTGLPFTFGDTPDTVTVELPRKDAEFFARHEFTSRPNAVVSTACRAALGGEQK